MDHEMASDAGDLSETVTKSVGAAAEQLHHAASSISGSQLDLASCTDLGALMTQILANLVTVTERMAERTATVGADIPLRHELGEDPVEHLTAATRHLTDLRARLSSAVASSGSYRHEMKSVAALSDGDDTSSD